MLAHGPMNILLITLDQFRGDCLSCAGHPVVRTPNLDRLAAEGARLARHYSQAAPCGPGRASLYTGLYQMNHRVVGNGTPLDARFDTIAKAARRAGYAPTLFGYTDQAIDPREADGPADPRLRTYEEVLPGFEVGVHLPMGEPTPWLEWLRDKGHSVPDDPHAVLASEPHRPAEHSMAAFLTDRFLDWLGRQDRPWFAHLSHLRPHPPYAAAGAFASRYAGAQAPEPISAGGADHPLYRALQANPAMAAPAEPALSDLRTQYFGMVSEVDAQLGRVWESLKTSGAWDETFIVVTSDHGEQLGDHGLIGKGGFFEESYRILGVVRDPRPTARRGLVIDRFTENVDVFPTLCEAMDAPVPIQCDGLPLSPLLAGTEPPWWREAAHWEFDTRTAFIGRGTHEWPWDRRLERRGLCVRRSETAAYAHFGDGSSLAFDLAVDPTWRTPLADPQAVLREAQAMLTWRAQHAERTLTGAIIDHGVVGRAPPPRV
ncbi:MAG TPA: sulfatase-like hydrolase/transferase [Caulobacteraceae bacterium]|nr:sulfatase-like hydrolase/transferase [Caulobacteraceae bacterium]